MLDFIPRITVYGSLFARILTFVGTLLKFLGHLVNVSSESGSDLGPIKQNKDFHGRPGLISFYDTRHMARDCAGS
jgi:hypothetical protein